MAPACRPSLLKDPTFLPAALAPRFPPFLAASPSCLFSPVSCLPKRSRGGPGGPSLSAAAVGGGPLASRWLHAWRCFALSHGCIAPQCLLALATARSCLVSCWSCLIPTLPLACLCLTAALPPVLCLPMPPLLSATSPHLTLALFHGRLTWRASSPHTCRPHSPPTSSWPQLSVTHHSSSRVPN